MLKQYFGSPDDPNFVLAEVTIDWAEAMTPHQKPPILFIFRDPDQLFYAPLPGFH